MLKTAIEFFEDISVRVVWDGDTAKWWFSAVDFAEALTTTRSLRSY